MRQRHGMDRHRPLLGPLRCLQAREQMIDAQAVLPKMRWPNRPKDGGTDRRTDGWTDGRMDGRMDGQRDGWTDGRTDSLIEVLCSTEKENLSSDCYSETFTSFVHACHHFASNCKWIKWESNTIKNSRSRLEIHTWGNPSVSTLMALGNCFQSSYVAILER